ncbi:prolyl oligopeptidase family serine peptidase [Gemmatimonadales bacterium]|nr:prolyl oligopeptidase family serine peptidase [Gemmatimonadales bacterium]
MRTNKMILAVAVGLVSAMPLSAQEKPALTEDNYDQWERLGAAVLSPNGAWMAVSVGRVSEEGELRIHSTRSDSVVIVPFGSRPMFSSDNRWVAYTIDRSEEEREVARERDQEVYDKLGLLNLETGEQIVRDDFASFQFSDDGRYLALRRYKPKDKESNGVDVVVHDLLSDRDMSFGNVSDMVWQGEGTLLAMTTDADGQVGNGVTVYDPSSGSIRSMDTDEATYRQLSWRDNSSDLVVFKTSADEVFEDTAHVALVWRDVAGDGGLSYELSSETNDAFPASMRIVEFRAPSWSDDGQTLFVGIQERRPAPLECGDDDTEEAAQTGECLAKEEAAGVEIWHTLDRDPVPQQRVRERQLRRANYLSAWNVESGDFVQLGDDLTERTTMIDGGRHVIGGDETPYDEHAMFRQQFSDLYVIDVKTGAKSKIVDRIYGGATPSPDGRYIIWFSGEHWYAHDLDGGETTNITERVGTVFVDLDVTPTREQMPSFGIAGWMEDGRSVLLNDEWDLWRVRLDGLGGEAITFGASESVRYRLASRDLDGDDDGIGSDEKIYYSVYSEWTKKSGFAAAEAGNEPELLVWEDKNFGGFSTPFLKAEGADVFAFRMEGFDDSPDYFVAGRDLKDPRQVTNTNPFQDDYAWGRVELVDYANEWGRRLQGVLTYPANYDPSVSYPMIVYHYELLSQGMHQYQIPDPTRYYNQQIWSQNGYFVFRPDIVYRDRRPGQSNAETLRPAVAAALAKAAAIDEEKIGLIGHSWGGYQTTYFVTQDDLFASAVAGAPLTNLMSMYLSFYWNSGGTDAKIFEISQGRMQVPWWEDWDSYEANSPLHHIQNMETPLLMMFGTNDGAVEYNQGVEFYNAARRLGKQMVMLSYDGENHGLAREPNQLDYQRRIMQWFGHYLKGEPAPDWISTGVPYVTQKDRLKVKRLIG